MRSVRRRATAAEPEIGYNTSIWLIDSLTDAYISRIYVYSILGTLSGFTCHTQLFRNKTWLI